MENNLNYFFVRKNLIFIISLILFFLNINLVFGASLILSPSSKNINVNDSFSLTVIVNSADQAINAVSAEITWPVDILKLVNFSKSQSIIKFWVKEPELSNNQIDFEGVIFNPGYLGNNGKILTLNFKALKTGTAEIKFASGMVLANDGQGTNILSMMNGSSIVINKKTEVQEVPEVVEEKIPESGMVSLVRLPKPEIFSPTHPDPQKWYSNNQPIFEWQLPTGITEVRTDYGNDPYLIPKDSFSPPIKKRRLDNVLDGTYYFAVQFVRGDSLSEISRLKFNIDTQPPHCEEFSLKLIDQNSVSLKIKLKDELSGLETSNIYLDNKLIKKLNETNYYEEIFKDLDPGGHMVKIETIDKVGNRQEKSEEVIIPKPTQIIVEKDYTIYWMIALLILILVVLIFWFYVLRRKLDNVYQEVKSQKLDHVKKDFHNYFTQFLHQARDELSLLDDDSQLSDQEKEIYRKIREIIGEAEIKIRSILDKLK